MMERDCGAAVAGFRRALEIFREFRAASLNLATCLEWMGDGRAAEKLYREMLEKNPGDGVPAARLVRICTGRNDWPCVAATVRGVLDANPDAAREGRVWVMLGSALLRSGKEPPAEEAYRRAIALTKTPVAHFALAGLLAGQGRWRAALDEYQSAARLGMKSEELYVDWAAACRRVGDARSARAIAADGLRRFPTSQALMKMAR